MSTDDDRASDRDRPAARMQREAERRREAGGRGGLSPNASQRTMRQRRAGRLSRGES